MPRNMETRPTQEILTDPKSVETPDDQAFLEYADSEIFGNQTDPFENTSTSEAPNEQPLAIQTEKSATSEVNTPATSRIGDRIRDAADRIANLFDSRAASKVENQETAPTVPIKEIGSSALHTVDLASVLRDTLVILAVEKGLQLRNKIAELAQKATERLEKRRLALEQELLRREWVAAKAAHMNNLHGQALEENKLFDDHTQAIYDNEVYDNYDKATIENEVFDAYPEAEKTNEMFDKQTEAEAMNEQFDRDVRYNQEAEAEQMHEKFEEARRQARIKAEVARRIKARRKSARDKFYGDTRQKGSELLSKAKKGIGRLALKSWRSMKRTGKRVGKAVSAAKSSWQETNQ